MTISKIPRFQDNIRAKESMELRRICFDYLQEAGLFVGWLGRLGSCLKLYKLFKLI